MADLLAAGVIRILSVDWLLKVASKDPPLRIERRQAMPPRAYLEPEVATDLFLSGERRLAVLSYRWLTQAHPDPCGQHLEIICNMLRRVGTLEGLFWVRCFLYCPHRYTPRRAPPLSQCA